MKNDLGQTIAELRKNKGLTQQELADMIFCSKELVGKIETGKRAVNTSFLIELSTILEFNFVQYSKNLHKYKNNDHYNLVHTMIDLFSNHNYKELEKILMSNPLTKELNYGSVYIIAEYCKALVLVNLHRDYLNAEKVLLKVLKNRVGTKV